MAQIYEFEGLRPVVAESAYVHPNATLIGDVVIGPRCYIAPGAVLRGDMGRIELHDGANVQDNCVLHSFPGVEMVIETDGHIGHGVILHGCCIKRNALVGMNAVVMDRVVVGENAFVAAMAFVKEGFEVPANSLVAGIPARIVRQLSEQEIAWKGTGTEIYHCLAERSPAGLKPVEPLREVEPNRPQIDWSDNAMKPLKVTREG